MSEFKDQLLSSAGVRPERIMEFSCGELIELGPDYHNNEHATTTVVISGTHVKVATYIRGPCYHIL